MDIRTVLENVQLGNAGLGFMNYLGGRYWFIETLMKERKIDSNTNALRVVNTLLSYEAFQFEASKVAFFTLDKTIPWKQIWEQFES